MPRTEPKIVANATVPRNKTTAVKLTACLMRGVHSLYRGERFATPILTLAAGSDTLRRKTPFCVKSTELIQAAGQRQQAGGARVDWERDTSMFEGMGLDWPR
jgi:hypothetical protein